MAKAALEQKDILLHLLAQGKLPLDRLELSLLKRLLPVLKMFDDETKNVKIQLMIIKKRLRRYFQS